MRFELASASALVMASAACQADRTACEELKQMSPQGVTLASEETRCAQMLDFARLVSTSYEMDFPKWLEVVPRQRIELMYEATQALTRDDWMPMTFAAEPAKVPCAPGLPIDDAFWSRSPLANIYPKRPERLYVSFSREIDAPRGIATLRAYEDFDCDGILGVQELVGEFHQGRNLAGGGWRVIRSTLPALDE